MLSCLAYRKKDCKINYKYSNSGGKTSQLNSSCNVGRMWFPLSPDGGKTVQEAFPNSAMILASRLFFSPVMTGSPSRLQRMMPPCRLTTFR